MSVQEYIEAQHRARQALLICASYARERDTLIRNAHQLGITQKEIAAIFGMSRQQIGKIANQESGQDGPQSPVGGEQPAPTRKG